VVFSLLALALYWPSLAGPFLSDDLLYIVTHPWVANPSPEGVLGMLDPMGDARLETANYAPVHLLLTAAERQVFWDDPVGYHVVNVLVHAINAVLLATLFSATGVSERWALLGGLIFLVHPGNVEAVAWASQLKSVAAMAFALAALLALQRHPGWATLLFILGLLTKASGAFVLPMAGALLWVRGSAETGVSRAWRWLGLWLLGFALYSVPQYTAMHPRGLTVVAAYADPLVHLQTIASVGMHYLAMAVTSVGVAYAQEHPPTTALLDPWVVSALVAVPFFVWRIGRALRRRSYECVYWIGAAAAFVPISQLWSFSHPIADRYLYFELPGLIGGTLLLLRSVGSAAAERLAGPPFDPWAARLPRAVSVALVVVVVIFAARTSVRSNLWTDETLLAIDSARRFPEGRSALRLKASHAAQTGDRAASVEFLRRAIAAGSDQLPSIALDSTLDPLRGDPGFEALVDDLASRSIERIESREDPTQTELAALAGAYFERGDYDEALRVLERAHARGGFLEERMASELEALKEVLSQIGADGTHSRTP
jgi:tetratricopeptide (TPR) repeat protein